MFAGIVETVGKVVALDASPRQTRHGALAHGLEVAVPELLDDLPTGASVAINGVCLTLAGRQAAAATFDVIPETWRNTNLHALRVGDGVNVERSLRLGDRLEGHFVQGHVDGVGRVERIERGGGEWKLWIAVEPHVQPYLLRKGSIAVDGTSLTIVDVRHRAFSVALIPTTLERTMLARRAPGDLVNIETDVLARLVISRLAALGVSTDAHVATVGLTLEELQARGFT